jgi:hypothetical protein
MFSIYRNQSALVPLNEAWAQADAGLREEILQASHRVDQQLQNDPLEQGESRDGQTRILFEAPVAVTFAVDEAKKLVRILRAWTYRSGSGR